MPLTPKGYCDLKYIGGELLASKLGLAEMPLTPKGYCDRFLTYIRLSNMGTSINIFLTEIPIVSV